MSAEIGHFSLILALLCASYQAFFGFFGGVRRNAQALQCCGFMAMIQLFFVGLSFFSLLWCHLVSDFSVSNVYFNSHTAKPLLYKISGVWGNHEGSLLLWCLILSVFGAIFSFCHGYGRHNTNELSSLESTMISPSFFGYTLGTQGLIGVAFFLFIEYASLPFSRLNPAPLEGRGLNPLLQDPALAFHPPFLYTGYVGLSLTFSLTIAGLLSGKLDLPWARSLRFWTLLSWCFLTIGIALGSWWAYYELGWGGFWFWDPVENASLMPWLCATALLHGIRVVEKSNDFKGWIVLLALFSFLFSLLGTFLVRSGILTSVHAFAVDSERGLFILAILGFFTFLSLLLYTWKSSCFISVDDDSSFSFWSRKNLLTLQTVIFFSCVSAVFIGTLYPLVLDTFWSLKISVGPPYFQRTFVPLMALALLFLPIAPLLPWKSGSFSGVLYSLRWALSLSVLSGLAILLASVRGPWMASLGIGLGVWLILGTLTPLFKKDRFSLAELPLGMMLSHLGSGIFVLGIVGATAWSQEDIFSMPLHKKHFFSGIDITLTREETVKGPNYEAERGAFLIQKPGDSAFEITSEKRVFFPSQQPTTEVGLLHFWSGDLYLVMGDRTAQGLRNVRVQFHPLISLLWGGAFLMTLGGVFSLSSRKTNRAKDTSS